MTMTVRVTTIVRMTTIVRTTPVIGMTMVVGTMIFGIENHIRERRLHRHEPCLRPQKKDFSPTSRGSLITPRLELLPIAMTHRMG